MRKGRRKTGLRMCICLAAVILAGTMLLHTQLKKTYSLPDSRSLVHLSAVPDGTYDGTEETQMYQVNVVVTVQEHGITDNHLLHQENGQGTPAKAMISTLLQANTSEVDEVSFVTVSSKVIRAAVRNVLNLGTMLPDEAAAADPSSTIAGTTPS